MINKANISRHILIVTGTIIFSFQQMSNADEVIDRMVELREPIIADLYKTGKGVLNEQEKSLSEGVGVGFSGGGSRALALASGQLAALKKLGFEEKIKRLSLVSGGAWAVVPYYMLPNENAQKQFLGTVIEDLYSLCWKDTHSNADEAPECSHPLNHVEEKSLQKAPQRLGYYSAAISILRPQLYPHWFSGYDGWKQYLSKHLLQPYGINGDAPLNQSRFPQLKNKELIVTAQLIDQSQIGRPLEEQEKIPFKITPNQMGRFITEHPHNDYYVHPYSFGRRADTDSLYCSDNTDKCRINLIGNGGFTVSDMMAVTSSRYASNNWFRSFAPTFSYPKIDFSQNPPLVSNTNAILTDDGDMDFLGLLPLLADKQQKALLLSNSGKRLHTNGKVIGMEKVIPSYFGVIPDENAEKHRYHTAEELGIPRGCHHNSRRNHVFLTEKYEELAKGLLKAKEAGEPIVFLQKNLQVLDNPCHGITKGSVDVLWVYNELPNGWMDKLNPELKDTLSNDNNFSSFPLYNSMDLYLTEAQTNLLFHLAAWNLLESTELLTDFFKPK